MVVGARDQDLAGFERLAQRIKYRSCEFGEFVEKQDAAMSQGNLAGARPRAATDKRGHRGGVVRVTKRARLDQPAGGKLAGNRMKHCDIEGLARGQGWQQSGKPRRKHRLVGAGRADQ